MAKENKEVTERMREDIAVELADVLQAKAEIVVELVSHIEKFNEGRKIPFARVDIKEAAGGILELLDDLFHSVTKELNNRLEDL